MKYSFCANIAFNFQWSVFAPITQFMYEEYVQQRHFMIFNIICDFCPGTAGLLFLSLFLFSLWPALPSPDPLTFLAHFPHFLLRITPPPQTPADIPPLEGWANCNYIHPGVCSSYTLVIRHIWTSFFPFASSHASIQELPKPMRKLHGCRKNWKD
jgi:hypothetical protein